jgi:hypothetical protein
MGSWFWKYETCPKICSEASIARSEDERKDSKQRKTMSHIFQVKIYVDVENRKVSL